MWLFCNSMYWAVGGSLYPCVKGVRACESVQVLRTSLSDFVEFVDPWCPPALQVIADSADLCVRHIVKNTYSKSLIPMYVIVRVCPPSVADLEYAPSALP